MVFSVLNQQTLFSAVNICLVRPSLSISTSYISFVSYPRHVVRRLSCNAALGKSDSNTDNSPSHNPKLKRKGKSGRQTSKQSESEGDKSEGSFPGIIPKKPRRGRRSEAAAVEDYVRDSLERTLESIRKQNPEVLENMQNFMKGKTASDDDTSDDEDDNEDNGSGGAKNMVVEEEDPDWPLDTDVGWGIRASEYFDQHPIKNVVGEDGAEIDWEGEIDYGMVKEINCLEWESFAFHPSPLIVLVFERYNRASDNWKALKELEKAAEVYWKAKDRLPPRTVKVDINIEKDLAYALKVREGPELLFLRGNKILYREKDIRSADELVQMIAYFYYNAKKPPCINDAVLSSLQ